MSDQERTASNRGVRRLVVWCPDWPVVAATRSAGASTPVPAAVFHANRVVACSETARLEGVRRGMRRRESQGRCPELVVREHDPTRDARLFEPVAAAVETAAPGLEIVRPGLIAVPAKGPAGYFGSAEAAAERIVDEVSAADVECQVGIADGLFAAILAARRGVIVEPGGSPEFLSPLLIDEIDQPSTQSRTDQFGSGRAGLVDLLRRLGIRTLGDFAALPGSDVLTRFGMDAWLAHRSASGLEERPPERRRPRIDLTVTEDLDPPVERVDAAAFVAKALAERLHGRLAGLGLACIRLGIGIRTEHGEQSHRVWRCAEPLSPQGTADRVRWQLDGWLNGRQAEQCPTAGVNTLMLSPEEVVDAGALQLDLADSRTEADAQAGRAFARVQGMLGPEGVVVGVLGGGRTARDQVRLVPWGDEREPALDPDPPWPGRLPAPSPSWVPEEPWPADVLDELGCPVRITERHRLTASPDRIVAQGRSRAVAGWGGPWPVTRRWWLDPVIRVQVILTDEATVDQSTVDDDVRGGGAVGGTVENETDSGEVGLLLTYEQARWWVQGVYR